jgi:catalase
MLYFLSRIDSGLAGDVAAGLGTEVPKKIEGYLNLNVGADADPKPHQPKKFTGTPHDSPPLSIVRSAKPGLNTAKIAVLAADGVDARDIKAIVQAVKAAGGQAKLIAPHGGNVTAEDKSTLPVDFSLPTVASVLFDAVCIPGGIASTQALAAEPRAAEFVEEAFKHCKAIAAFGSAAEFLKQTRIDAQPDDPAVIIGDDQSAKKVAATFIEQASHYRNWDRELRTLPNG